MREVVDEWIGGWKKYDRGSGACNDQAEGGDADAVFLLEGGATLQNVIIGKNQAEGVHCKGRKSLSTFPSRAVSLIHFDQPAP